MSPRTLIILAVAALVALQAPATVHAKVRGDMVRIQAGSYQPLYGNGSTARVQVASFRIDRDAVTRAQFQQFVRANPVWSRSLVRSIMANRATYLADWVNDTDPGSAIPQDAPVTSVSWFAARAFCESKGKRLPSIAEWEYVAAASDREMDAARQPQFIQELVTVYASRPKVLPPVYAGRSNIHGVRGLHDLVSEWVEDFNSVLVSDDSRGVGGRDHDMFCASAAIGAVDPGNYPAFLRYALRSGLSGRSTLQSLGFRCAS